MHLPRQTQSGAIPYVIIGIIIVVIIIVIVVATSGRGTVPPSQIPGTNTCFTYCIGLVEFQCGDNEVMGVCFGVWDCRAEIGPHDCQ